MTPSTVAYYLMVIGGSLTIMTSIIMLVGSLPGSYYNRYIPFFNTTPLPLLYSFTMTILPGLATLWLGQRFLRKPDGQTKTALAVVALSIVSVFAVVNWDVFLYTGVLFSGPPICFTGGLLGALSGRTSISAN
jgi:hypothetical protein